MLELCDGGEWCDDMSECDVGLFGLFFEIVGFGYVIDELNMLEYW